MQEPADPVLEATGDDDYTVSWDPSHASPDEIQAELPDGTRVQPVTLIGGRVGFERELPRGTQLLLRGKPAWRRVGESG